jgi:hypothetical protein
MLFQYLGVGKVASYLEPVRFVLNPCRLGGIGWVSIPNKSKSFIIVSNPIQPTWDRNKRTSP